MGVGVGVQCSYPHPHPPSTHTHDPRGYPYPRQTLDTREAGGSLLALVSGNTPLVIHHHSNFTWVNVALLVIGVKRAAYEKVRNVDYGCLYMLDTIDNNIV